MARFFFHLRSAEFANADEEGIELPNIEVARAHAIKLCRELIGNINISSIEFEIADNAGRTLLIVPCSEAKSKLQ